MNFKKITFIALALVFVLMALPSAKTYACSGGCSATSTATSTCGCQGKGTCDCAKDGKTCECKNCSADKKDCGCSGTGDCKCKADGKDCQCGNCKLHPTTTQAKADNNNASQQGRMARIKGWLKGLAFWKKK